MIPLTELNKLVIEISAMIRAQLNENATERFTEEAKALDRHEYLLALDYQIGKTMVCNHIRSQSISEREAFISIWGRMRI
jgi:hypothetical protein